MGDFSFAGPICLSPYPDTWAIRTGASTIAAPAANAIARMKLRIVLRKSITPSVPQCSRAPSLRVFAGARVGNPHTARAGNELLRRRLLRPRAVVAFQLLFERRARKPAG